MPLKKQKQKTHQLAKPSLRVDVAIADRGHGDDSPVQGLGGGGGGGGGGDGGDGCGGYGCGDGCRDGCSDGCGDGCGSALKSSYILRRVLLTFRPWR